MDAKTEDGMRAALADVVMERMRQDAKWGEQNHPMVPRNVVTMAANSGEEPAPLACFLLGVEHARAARALCEAAHRNGNGTYTHILVKKVAEMVETCVLHGETSDEARAEMVQVAAVALAMVEAIDRKRAVKGAA